MYKPELPPNAGPIEWIGPENLLSGIAGLIHCVRVPGTASLRHPAPVVVMLHGWGGDESAMWVFRQVVSAETAIVTPRAPVEPGIGGCVWFTYLDAVRARPDLAVLRRNVTLLKHFLRTLPDLYPVDPARLVLLGFSQGAAMVNSLALSGFRDLKGAVSLAGFIPHWPGLVEQADPLAGFPVFITHGTRDDIVPLADAHRTRDVYTRLGADVTYHEYPVGHKVHTRGLKELKRWMSDLLA